MVEGRHCTCPGSYDSLHLEVHNLKLFDKALDRSKSFLKTSLALDVLSLKLSKTSSEEIGDLDLVSHGSKQPTSVVGKRGSGIEPY